MDMQKRKFGGTGLETTILGFGGFHLLEIPLREAGVLLNGYLDAGGNYIETAAGYGDGESERKIGRSVGGRRDEYVLVTKAGQRDAQGCAASLERSLRNLNTDHVDVLLMHGVGTKGELDAILGPGGALEAAERAVRDGKTRFVGISMHGQPDVLLSALAAYDFAAVMTTVNYYDRFNFPEIEDELLPLANRKGAAVILMKPLADGLLWRSAEAAFRYAFSRAVSVVVTGINSRDMLAADLKFAEEYKPMTEAELEALYRDAPELGTYVCRQCGECLPCPEGIDIPAVFKLEGYYDRQMADGIVTNAAEYALKDRLRFWFGNRDMARARYAALRVKADCCTACGKCASRCPYGIDIVRKLGIADYKLAGKEIY
jgi:predicted aldo/keto reductase-like oxidoreductase